MKKDKKKRTNEERNEKRRKRTNENIHERIGCETNQ
jgi:hypothetical protein